MIVSRRVIAETRVYGTRDVPFFLPLGAVVLLRLWHRGSVDSGALCPYASNAGGER